MAQSSTTATSQGQKLRDEIFALLDQTRTTNTLEVFINLFVNINKLYSTKDYEDSRITEANLTAQEQAIGRAKVYSGLVHGEMGDHCITVHTTSHAKQVMEGLGFYRVHILSELFRTMANDDEARFKEAVQIQCEYEQFVALSWKEIVPFRNVRRGWGSEEFRYWHQKTP